MAPIYMEWMTLPQGYSRVKAGYPRLGMDGSCGAVK